MKKSIVYIFVLISIIASAAPTKKQLTLLKKDISTIKSCIKSGKDLEKSEKTLRSYLNDSLFSEKRLELQELLCDVLKKSYQNGNEQMYLQIKNNTSVSSCVDTASIVNTGRRMFLAYERMDSLAVLSSSSGLSSSRRRNSQYLLPYRTNIFMGGLFFIHKKDWSEAWKCFDIYLQCPYTSLFSEDDLPKKDSLTCKVAFLSLVSAVRLDSLPLAKKYATLSTSSNNKTEALEMLSEMCITHGDSVGYETYLRQGFASSPENDYFFPHLLDLLSHRNAYTEALEICDSALSKDTLNTMFLLGKHGVLMDLKKYDDAIDVGNKVIALNDSLDTPYYNIGYIYHQKAAEAMKSSGKTYRQRVAKAQKYYKLCLPYMERYRSLSPYDRKRWKPILYDVYLNLNMGKEFSEIENL